MTFSLSLYGSSGCIGNLSKSQSLPDSKLKRPLRKKSQDSSTGNRRRWQSGLEAMEKNVSISVSLEGNISSIPNSIVNDSKTSMENGLDTSFINHDVQREEKNVEKAIREAAKRNDMGSAKALAKELVRSRRAVNRLYENKAQLNSVSMHLGEIVATARTVGHLSKSTEVMKIVNNLMKAPELAATMQEFSKEMTKAGVMEEMVNEAVDSALDSEDMEEEIEEEVDKVLASVAGETASQLPDAARTQKIHEASTSRVPERQAVAEGADDEEEDLEEIRARLAKKKPPENLQTLKIHGLVKEVPAWVSHLPKLRKLELEITMSKEGEVIQVLGDIKELRILRLCVKPLQDGNGNILNFCVMVNGVEVRNYLNLKILEIACNSELNVSFGSVAMENLELLTARCHNGSAVKFTGLNKLSKYTLKQVRYFGSLDNALKVDMENQLYQHPKTPSFKLEEPCSS